MACWRTTLLGLALLGGGACLLLAACGDSEEVEELRSYSRWVDGIHAEQEAALSPMQNGWTSLQSFLQELPAMANAGNLPAIFASARSARDLLHAVRDRVRPAHAALREKVMAMEPGVESISEVHRRLVRAVELRDRALVTLSALADRVDELLALEGEEVDEQVRADVDALARELDAAMKEGLGAYEATREPLDEAVRRALDALGKAGQGRSKPAGAAMGILGKQDAVFRSVLERLRTCPPAQLVPALTRVEEEDIPEFELAVDTARRLELPAPGAREPWGEVVKQLETRLAGLRKLPALRPRITRWLELGSGTPAMAAMKLVEQILGRAASIREDLAQATAMYENFKTELRRLRASVL